MKAVVVEAVVSECRIDPGGYRKVRSSARPMHGNAGHRERRWSMSRLFCQTVGSVMTSVAGAVLLYAPVAAEEGSRAIASGDQATAYRAMALGLAAAFAIAVSVLGAGYAVGRIGSAALGAISEKPELLTRAILFVALAEGLAVLGFAVAMMLMQKI
jgi:V/A-type H+-transporting ATPase subunit K